MAEIDALCALAETSNSENMVQPVVLAISDKPYIRIK